MSQVEKFLSGMSNVGKYVSNQFYFTKFKDTPTGYLGHSGDYLVVNDDENGISFTGIEKIASDLIDYGFSSVGTLFFTGLKDTPTGYQSGYYLRSTKTGIEYISSTGLAADIGKSIDFTGLKDTPTGYDNLSLLQSSNNGINYITADDLSDILPVKPRSYGSVEELPVPASSYDREIFKVGCDLYLSCGGLYVKITTSTQEEGTIPGYPNCVNTTFEALEYRDYIDETMQDYNSVNLLRAMDGLPPVELYNVCLFKQEDFDLVSANEPWTVRGTLGIGDGWTATLNNNPEFKFKKGSDQLYAYSFDTPFVLRSNLRIDKINDLFQIETVWSKTIDNVNHYNFNISDDFKHITHPVRTVEPDANTNAEYDILVLDYDESVEDYIQVKPPINRQLLNSLYPSETLGSHSGLGIKQFRTSQDGNRVFALVRSGDAFSNTLKLYITEWDGSNWSLKSVMSMPVNSGINNINMYSFKLSENEDLIYLIAETSNAGVYYMNYANSSMNIRRGQGHYNHLGQAQNVMTSDGNIISTCTSFTSSNKQPNKIWKWNETIQEYEHIH
ncbi:MAG: hypothetical protein EBY39_12595, partial [Flavobacteriia bacterium]|nr:hypothetical protein [Flavobacteriia bacterium]